MGVFIRKVLYGRFVDQIGHPGVLFLGTVTRLGTLPRLGIVESHRQGGEVDAALQRAPGIYTDTNQDLRRQEGGAMSLGVGAAADVCSKGGKPRPAHSSPRSFGARLVAQVAHEHRLLSWRQGGPHDAVGGFASIHAAPPTTAYARRA